MFRKPSKSSKGEDSRRFRHFRLYCIRHSLALASLGEITKHRREIGEGRNSIKILCGCCGKIFRQMELLSDHVNLEGFHLRTSKIPGYSVSSFNLERYFTEQHGPSAPVSTPRATGDARAAAAAARQAEAAAAAHTTQILQGASAPFPSPRPSFSLSEVVDDVLSAFDPLPFSVPSCCDPLLAYPPVSASLLSLSTSTAPTVTWSNSNPLASVFLLTDSVSTSTVTQAPLSSSLAGPAPLVEVQTPTRDEPQEVNTPAVHGTPLSAHAPSPAAPATLFLRSPSIISSLSQPAVVSSGPLPHTQPDSTQPGAVFLPPNLPMYTAFGSMFPRHYFASVDAMPTTALIQSLTHALQWTSGLLRGILREHPLPPTLVPLDEMGRATLMATPLWPGDQFSFDTPLPDLLAAFLPLYSELLARGAYHY